MPKRVFRFSTGFTLVELLVVIVVISTLASIILVTYNGITTRAYNSRTLSGVSQFTKALDIYYTYNNKYPATASDGSGDTVCVGDSTADCGEVGFSDCGAAYGGTAPIAGSDYLADQIKDAIGERFPFIPQPKASMVTKLADPSDPSIPADCKLITETTGVTYSAYAKNITNDDGLVIGGSGLRDGEAAKAYIVRYFLKGDNQDCQLAHAQDLTEEYKKWGALGGVPDGWTSCTAAKGASY